MEKPKTVAVAQYKSCVCH